MVDFLRKRLQVFVSSTYSDLIPERQAAVEAILVAGHIPAGMELFTAGDDSQMEAIRQWIDESDVYMLILGGRYGSIDSHTGKSYTHLEYEYATGKGKPIFTLVITDVGLDRLALERGRTVLESENPQGLKALRTYALGKLVRFWSDAKDIRIAIGETLSNFARREDLQGWVRPQDQSNVPLLAGEIARLSKENSELRERLGSSDSQPLPLGIGYQAILQILEARKLITPLVQNTKKLLDRYGMPERGDPALLPLLELGLLKRRDDQAYKLTFSEEGKAFLNWLKLKELKSGANLGD